MANLKTVSELKDSVAGILAGVDLNNVDDLNATLERSVSNTQAKLDIPETIQYEPIMLYNGVYNYPIDSSIYGTALVDIAPQSVNRNAWNGTMKTSLQQFDRTKQFLPSGNVATFKYINGSPIIQINTNVTIPQASLDTMTETTGWTNGGSAGTLYEDTAVYYQEPSSIRFTLTGSSAGTLTKSISLQDLSSYQGVGVAFLAVYIPDYSTLTSITLKIGSDSSNYSSVTRTDGFLGSFTSNNWLLVDFNQANATDTGTPDWSAINYAELTFNHTGTQTNIRVGDLFISQPSANNIIYYSSAIFQATGGTTLSSEITDNTDTIILNIPAYTIYLYECVLAVLENMSGGMGDPMYERVNQKLNGNGSTLKGLYGQYAGDNPSQELRQVTSYYDVRNNWGYNRNGAGY